MAQQIFYKDPDADLDFVFDWSSWLAAGETISSETITAATGITLGTGAKAPSESGGVITVWLSGGTAGTIYTVACKIVTSKLRTDERTIEISIMNR